MVNKNTTDVVKDDGELIEKAGGIITRQNSKQELELYIVHRPRYDDWSMPKGHIDSGETNTQAALREVAEETGFHCSIERTLPPFFYQLPTGEHSVVHYYEMKFLDSGEAGNEHAPEKDEEVDEGKWLSLAPAIDLITYPSLQQYLKDIYMS